MDQTGQFVKYKKFKQIQKHTSLHVMIDVVNELEDSGETFVSKRVQFLDDDSVW